MVLEVSEAEKKSTYDADACSWKSLLTELEEEGHTDVTINAHELTKPSAGEGGLVQGENQCQNFLRPFCLAWKSWSLTPI